MNVHVPSEGKIYDIKDKFFEELQCEIREGKHFQTNNCECEFA
jgi:hypothetical protein